MVLTINKWGFHGIYWDLLSGNLLHGYGESPFLRGKSFINGQFMCSYVSLLEGKFCTVALILQEMGGVNYRQGLGFLLRGNQVER